MCATSWLSAFLTMSMVALDYKRGFLNVAMCALPLKKKNLLQRLSVFVAPIASYSILYSNKQMKWQSLIIFALATLASARPTPQGSDDDDDDFVNDAANNGEAVSLISLILLAICLCQGERRRINNLG